MSIRHLSISCQLFTSLSLTSTWTHVQRTNNQFHSWSAKLAFFRVEYIYCISVQCSCECFWNCAQAFQQVFILGRISNKHIDTHSTIFEHNFAKQWQMRVIDPVKAGKTNESNQKVPCLASFGYSLVMRYLLSRETIKPLYQSLNQYLKNLHCLEWFPLPSDLKTEKSYKKRSTGFHVAEGVDTWDKSHDTFINSDV